jgi:hypothetical protein
VTVTTLPGPRFAADVVPLLVGLSVVAMLTPSALPPGETWRTRAVI